MHLNAQSKIHHLTTEEVLESLNSGRDGLSSAVAQSRLIEFGPNSIEKIRGEPLALRFLRGFTHFFAIILWCGAGIAFFAEWRDPGGGMATLGWAILGVIVVNGIFSFWQEFRAEQAIAALQRLIPHQVKVLRDGRLLQLPTAGLVPGDLICLEEGDDVPADCRLIEAFGIRVNNSTITGESLPQARDTQPSQEEELICSKNLLLAGTSLFSGEGKAIVFSTGMHTEFGKIARLTQTAPDVLSPLQKEIIRLSRVIAAIAVSVGVCFFLVGRALGITFWENAIFALGIIVALVPEGLLPEVTLALATCSQRMARRNALIRHLPSVETLGCATVICTDKTGTLTQNRMAVRKLFLAGRFLESLASTDRLHPEEKEVIGRLCQVAINCEGVKDVDRDGKELLIGDPMEVALIEFARRVCPAAQKEPRLDELPFDSDRKRVSSLHEAANGLMLYTKGALELLLPLCEEIYQGAQARPLSQEIREQFLAAQEQMTRQGLRVLAFASRRVSADYDKELLEQALTLIGLVGLEDPPRPEVPEAIGKCREAGIKVIMVTGDHPNTAQAIGAEIGLLQSRNPVMVTGPQLRRMSDTQLQLTLDAAEIVFARTDADQKMRIVNALKRKGHVVAVTGDGVNDAPALKAAHIGIAMGMTGTDVAREAADMILTDDNFASIVSAIEEGRTVFANIRKFLTYVLSSNIAELVPCLAFVLFRLPLPLTVIQILSVDLGTDLLPALALGAEQPDHTIMKKPPRSRREGLFDLSLLLRAYLFLGAMVSAGSMAAYAFCLVSGGWHYGEPLPHDSLLYRQATTACLSGIICMQVINSSLCRSDRQSLFSLGLFSNRMLILGVLSEVFLILFIDYTPWGNAIFKTAPISAQVWLFILPFLVSMLIVEEVRKWFVRHSVNQFKSDHYAVASRTT